ncbi:MULTISPECIES: LytR/AlgR family response regulator transcription factor [Empedobacter]|uniref:LytR/AlgR family response regulator transcription factor n=1 Tax=Empedobacter TaxID=59734 RepID=UPI0025C5BA1F|nr:MULTISPECIES: LytTR family DNA-binding domain-containing protein [unclassified Empedobacter]
MTKIKYIILDDEPLAVELLKKHASENENLIVSLATTEVFEAIDFLKNNKVDLIFTDIQMPELTGIQFMKILDHSQKFIVTTSYQDYALESFNFHVFDYLLKPITKDRFDSSVKKYVDFFQTTSTKNLSTYLFVKADGKQVKINFSDLIYIEGLKDYIRIHTKTEKILVLETMKSFEEKLPNHFKRIHRSYIINLDFLTSIDGNSVYLNQKILPIGETYRKEMKDFG